jgi:hypothetical protein
MDFMRIYNDESLRCQDNLVSANMLVPGQFYFWQYNSLVVLVKCIGPLKNDYIKGIFIVYNRRLTGSSITTPLYVNRCRFYKIENPMHKEIKSRHHVTPLTLRMLAYNQLDNDTQIQYSYAANVYGQFPPIPPETTLVKTKN